MASPITVLLNRIRLDAEARGIASVKVEAPEERSLPALLVPALRSTLLRLSRGELLEDSLLTGMRALASFTKALKVKYEDIDLSIDADPETGLADSGDLDTDLTDLVLTLPTQSPKSCAGRTAIPTSSRSGASTAGPSPMHPRSSSTTRNAQLPRRLPSSTRAFSVCASIG